MNDEPDQEPEAELAWPMTFAQRKAIVSQISDIITNGETQRIRLAGVRIVMQMEELNMKFEEGRNRRLLDAIRKLDSETES
ncbi:hypothetical protein [Roseiconus lacunae]|uniref:Uncharacterized protein n=1 Tax=Roseiconus lacunae TaxID=2605694 RepID=A0ABT7PDV2_9BACT|nr:hypothetical protein [Roseiconus lacunae]MDM4014685.1 hypothetical protein [Roseiconus lacunae]